MTDKQREVLSGCAVRAEIQREEARTSKTDLTRAEQLTYELLYESSGHFREFVDRRRPYGYSKRDIWDEYSEWADGNETDR